MDLRDYLRTLRKGWPLILAFVVLGLAAGIGITLATTKVYQASVQVFVATSLTADTSGDSTDLQNGNTFTTDRVQSYVSIANAPKVTEPVVKQLKLKMSAADLADDITADAPLNKVLINLHVTNHSPVQAARIANAVATQFNKVVAETEGKDSNKVPIVKLTVIHPAAVPSVPVSPHKVLNIGLGFVLGLIIGVGVVVLRDVLDNTVKDTSEFDEAGVPAMGIVPLDKRTQSSPVAFRADPNSARSEAYRQIRTNLQFVDVDNPPHIISVTSALPGEGKSTTALNLAAALAEAGSRVCLVEADLRRPSLARALGLVGEVGFTTALIGKTPVEDVLQNAGQNLAVLTSGPIPPNPSELLITDHARQLIQQVAQHVDFVVIDTPPLLPVTDGATVATLADATLLVTRTGKTTREQAARSIDALEKVGRRPVGVVFNMVTRGRGGYSYEYGYYYTSAERPTRRLGRGSVGVAAGQASPDTPSDAKLDLFDPQPTDVDPAVDPADATPDATAPGAPTPDASTPDASTPAASTPDASTPDASTPDASTPDASTPDASARPGVDTDGGSWPSWSDGQPSSARTRDTDDTRTIPAYSSRPYPRQGALGDGELGTRDMDTPIATQTSLDLGAPTAAGSAPTIDDLHADFSAHDPWAARPAGGEERSDPATARAPWYADDDQRDDWAPSSGSNGFGQH